MSERYPLAVLTHVGTMMKRKGSSRKSQDAIEGFSHPQHGIITQWCPQTIAKLVNNSDNYMLYGTYDCSYWGLFLPTFTSRGWWPNIGFEWDEYHQSCGLMVPMKSYHSLAKHV